MSDMDNSESIAVIGMAGRFPGAGDIADLWRNLAAGTESITRLSDEEFLARGGKPLFLDNPNFVRASPILEGADLFDAAFFDISPRDAETLDPQHRLMLETCYHALEIAGYAHARYRGRIALFAGAGMSHYLLGNLLPGGVFESQGYLPLVFAADKDYLPTRISYKLNLKGPSVNVNTACSTSLVATHLACACLLNYECDIALAGGVSVQGLTGPGYLYQVGGIASPDGHCRPFDAQAQGTVPSSGVGVVVLKRLEDALADNDTIDAVIKGSAINNDGADKVGYTAPGVDGQVTVIKQALANAEVDPETVTYIEAHGTATPMGDPIEFAALKRAFATDKKSYCGIGSIKSNMGHMDAAAGVAGLIKTVLALKHKQLPPSLHFTAANPQIDFEQSPFYVNTTLRQWPRENGLPLRAGVSSFGIGGTNAHAVLEEEPPSLKPETNADEDFYPLLLSAKTENALEAVGAQLCTFLAAQPQHSLADIAFTLQVGREALPYRRALVVKNPQEAIDILDNASPQRFFSGMSPGDSQRVAFMYTGQGAQYFGMGRDLYKHAPVFKRELDRCAGCLQTTLQLDLIELLFNEEQLFSDEQQAAELLRQTRIAQPVLFCFEYSLTRLLQAWGIEPAALIGHSLGEYVAACIAGVMTFEEALDLLVLRGELMQRLPPGRMLAVQMAVEKLLPLLTEDCALAAVNAPAQCVIAGPVAAIEQLQTQLEFAGTQCQLLSNAHAFHSPMVESILDDFRQAVGKVSLRPPSISFISNVTGTWITEQQAVDPEYWVTHMRQPVRFAEGIQVLLQNADTVLLEVGPGQVLTNLAKQNLVKQPETQAPINSLEPVISLVRHAKHSVNDLACALEAVVRLWLMGAEIDWSKFNAGKPVGRVPLPVYPFERLRYWLEPATESSAPAQVRHTRHQDLADWLYTPSWIRQDLLLRRGRANMEPENHSTKGEFEAGAASPIDSTLLFIPAGDQTAELIQALEAELSCYRLNGVAPELPIIRVVPLTREGDGNTAENEPAALRQLAADTYAIDPHSDKGYPLLFEALQARQLRPKNILHLWNTTSVEKQSGIEASIDAIRQSLDYGFYSLMYIAQHCKPLETLYLGVVSTNAYSVAGDEWMLPERHALAGTCKVLPLELQHIRCSHLDIPPITTEQATEPVLQARQILAEFSHQLPQPQVALRGQNRWLQRFEPLRIEAPQEKEIMLRQGGTYLITGGLGGMGLVFAQYLAAEQQANLVLVSRSGFPEQNRWDEVLAQEPETSALSEKIALLRNMVPDPAQRQSRLMICRADVASYEQMQKVVARARECFGDIHGVIHAAGVAGGGMTQLKTKAMADAVFKPKVYGAAVLNRLFESDPALDFLLLCSSQDSVVGALGQLDYCAANAYLDALAQRRNLQKRPRAAGCPVIAINWDAWRETGMAATAEVPPNMKAYREQSLKDAILSAEGVEVLKRALSCPQIPQLIVSTSAIAGKFQQLEALKLMLAASSRNRAVGKTHPRPNLSTDYVAPGNAIEEKVADIWQNCLGFTTIGVNDDFFELGGDSLVGISLIEKLQAAFGATFHITSLFEAPTIARFSEYYRAFYLEEEGDSRDQPPVDTDKVAFYREFVSRRTFEYPQANTRNKNTCFVLSAPRTGSTLLRVMLGGNPRIFSPPEMELLHFTSLKERTDIFGEGNSLLEGALEAIMNLKHCSADEAAIMMRDFVDQDLSVSEFYAVLHDWLQGRVLVEKSPTYASNPEVLRRMERDFEQPRYIHLSRHPYAMIRSYEKAKIDLLMDKSARDQLPFSRRQLAELIWIVSEQNTRAFLATIPAQRQRQIRYEDLVTAPATQARELCHFLQVDYHPDMLNIYQEKKNRMTAGLHAESRMLGDVNFHKHNSIDKRLAYNWVDDYREDFLGDISAAIARDYGYPSLAELKTSASPDDRAGAEPPETNSTPLNNIAIDRSAGLSPIKLSGSDTHSRQFIFIHPVGGSIFCYLPLAGHIKSIANFYTVESPGLTQPGYTYSTLEDMAADYIVALRDLLAEGACHLGGWSMGGVVAYEMAQQLARAGKEVASLHMIDSRAPNTQGIQTMGTEDRDILGALSMSIGIERESLERLDGLHSKKAILRALFNLGQERGKLPRSFSLEELEQRFSVLKNNAQCLNAYRPKALNIKPVLFMAQRDTTAREQSLCLGWRDLGKGVDTRPVDTDHYSIMSGDAIELIGRGMLEGEFKTR